MEYFGAYVELMHWGKLFAWM